MKRIKKRTLTLSTTQYILIQKHSREGYYMEIIIIGMASIFVLAIVFYFVIKEAVKNGINNSYLFSKEQRVENKLRELEETFKAIGHDVPEDMREFYEKKK